MSLATEEIDANPDVYLPDYLESSSTKADRLGLWVLCVSGSCSCGYTDWGIAPSWKVPGEWGGGFLMSQCPDCLGTVEYSDEWERVDRAARRYSDLRPTESDLQ